jgi:ElaB/YqjD/DUF883 family membrane-anchored ribosome-binding protein
MSDIQANLKSFAAKADDLRHRAADSLESAADTVRSAGAQSAGTIHDLAGQAGKKLESTASQVRKTYMKTGFRRKTGFAGFLSMIRRNPMRTLAFASVIGIVVAGISWRPAHTTE